MMTLNERSKVEAAILIEERKIAISEGKLTGLRARFAKDL